MSSGLRRAAQRLWSSPARRVIAGQPVHDTHPELLAPGELLPGVHCDELAERRRRLAEALPSNSIAILPAAPLQYVTGVIPHPYRQDADFLYLTGVAQPAVAVVGDMEAHGGNYTLFVPSSQPERERWDGARISPDAACQLFGADDAYTTAEMAERLCGLISGARSVFYDTERTQLHNEVGGLMDALAQGRVRPLRNTLHHLRWVKSGAEVQLLRQSATTAAGAIERCMRLSRPGISESVLATTFEHTCRLGGASRVAYPPVVASGVDSCTIHYGRNDKLLAGGCVVVMDAGCERHGYCSDITRTWPVGGAFAPAQRDVYEVVLQVHRQCLAAVKPGATLRSLHALSIQLLSEGLASLGVLPHLTASEIAGGPYRGFYPHSVGHWIGLDTHDCSSVSHERLLEPGVALTIEPGLYIPDTVQHGQLAGVGVRLEDDIIVTEGGCEVLSRQLPLEAADVEALVRDG